MAYYYETCEWFEEPDHEWHTDCGKDIDMRRLPFLMDSFDYCPYCGDVIALRYFKGEDYSDEL